MELRRPARVPNWRTVANESEAPCAPLPIYFLGRLRRLMRLRREHSGHLSDEGVRLIDRAIYSTYRDAVDLGVLAEAQKLIRAYGSTALE